jgi:hypothetical protein
MNTPLPPPPGPHVFVNDPVRVGWVIYTFVQAVVTVLLIAKVVTEVAGGIVVGVTTAAYAAVSELFVRPATVARQPLEEYAAAVMATPAPQPPPTRTQPPGGPPAPLAP